MTKRCKAHGVDDCPQCEGYVPIEPEDLLETVDGPPVLAPLDMIPTVTQEAPVATYRDWHHGNTRVITCRIANDLYRGPRYETREEAAQAVRAQHGRILEANYVPGRAFFRVYKD